VFHFTAPRPVTVSLVTDGEDIEEALAMVWEVAALLLDRP
jgi:hypothetical protein